MAVSVGGHKRYISMVVVLVLALLSWWFQRQESATGVEQPRDSHVVDYSMRDFEVMAMDEQGRPRHRLRAVSMQHYMDDGSSILEQPELLLYQPVGQPAGPQAVERWQLRAEQAHIESNGAEALLKGAVQVQHIDEKETVMQELLTRDLRVYVDQQRAESGAAVEIRERHGVTRAQGLKIDIKAGQIELLAAVRGEYVRER